VTVPEPPEPLSPAETRLLALVVLLREEAPRPDDSLEAAILRSARRQLVLRGALQELAKLLAGLGSALVQVLGLRRPGAVAP
jgi:hypothetical protein